MDTKKALLLVGSPRKNHSVSNSIGQYLLSNLKKSGYTDKAIYIYDSVKDDARSAEMTDLFNESDVIILSYPLYVDSLPANCIKALEYITNERKKNTSKKDQVFLALSNCGFYEKDQIKNSLNVCKFFAEENNLKWYGGIPLGGGPQFQGKTLADLGGMAKKLRELLDIASDCIIHGNPVPADKIDGLSSLPEPKILYFMMANLGFNHEAKKNGIKNINDTPFKK